MQNDEQKDMHVSENADEKLSTSDKFKTKILSYFKYWEYLILLMLHSYFL